jgi:hypothetical protein
MPEITAIPEFLELIKKSELLKPGHLEAYLGQLRSSDSLPEDAKSLARFMLRDGLLTRFQAGQILAGKARGMILSGKYRLLERLGKGGMGLVYLCEHMTMCRRVAIKVLPNAQAQDPGALERFLREARAAARLDHPNIVRAFDIDKEGTSHFLVMEYVDGICLDEYVGKHGPLDVRQAAQYVAQAANGLQHACEAGLVHRDIKPANLVVDREGTVKILDMGLALFFHDGPEAPANGEAKPVLGTADYFAPEQALNSQDVDIRADIYSLGVTFYYLLTGVTPFGEDGLVQKVIAHQLKEPKPLREVRQEVPAEMAEVVARMMAKDRAERYQTPGEVVKALKPWMKPRVPPPSPELLPQLCAAAQGNGPAVPGGASVVPSTASEVVGWRRVLKRVGLHSQVGWVAAVVSILALVIGVTLWTKYGPSFSNAGAAEFVLNAKGVTISKDNNNFHVATPKYEAVLSADGVFTNLRVGDVEFLREQVWFIRGTTFVLDWNNASEKPKRVTQTGANEITAEYPAATIRYEFGADSMRWTLTNSSDKALAFWLVPSKAVNAAMNDSGEVASMPNQRRWSNVRWFAGDVKVRASGANMIDFVTDDKLANWVTNLPPSRQSRELTFVIETATPEELAKVTAATAPPAP